MNSKNNNIPTHQFFDNTIIIKTFCKFDKSQFSVILLTPAYFFSKIKTIKIIVLHKMAEIYVFFFVFFFFFFFCFFFFFAKCKN